MEPETPKNPEDQVRMGQLNNLKVVKALDFGVYLDAGRTFGEILLPRRYVPQGIGIGDEIEVFLYTDSEDRFIATTEKPLAMAGEFALLKVVEVNAHGAFLDWGLLKDLILPFSEQKKRPSAGEMCTVRVFVDEQTNRVAASTKLEQFLNKIPPPYHPGDAVHLFICQKTDLGYSAIINNAHWGLLFKNEIFEPLRCGTVRRGFIKKIREDGKIDLSLYKPGYEKVGDVLDSILEALKRNGGFLKVTDKTPPEKIYALFGMSKKTYKKAVGALYKQRKIILEAEGIRLMDFKAEIFKPKP